MKSIRSLVFLMFTVSPLMQAMQGKWKVVGKMPTLVTEAKAAASVSQSQPTVKAVCMRPLITSLDDIEEWNDLSARVKIFFPKSFSQDSWNGYARELYNYLNELSSHNESLCVFDQASVIFNGISDQITRVSAFLKKQLGEQDSSVALIAFGKDLSMYIDGVLKRCFLIPSFVPSDVETVAKAYLHGWINRWQKSDRLRKQHAQAVSSPSSQEVSLAKFFEERYNAIKATRHFMEEVVLGEVLTFAFIDERDYKDIRSWSKANEVEFNLEQTAASTDELFHPEWSVGLTRMIAQKILRNYAEFKYPRDSKSKKELGDALCKKVENAVIANAFIEQIRLLPGRYEDAPEKFDRLMDALKNGQALPSFDRKDFLEAITDEEVKEFIFGGKKKEESVDVLDDEKKQSSGKNLSGNELTDKEKNELAEKKLAAFAKYSLKAFDKSFYYSKTGRWLSHNVLVNYLKKQVDFLFRDNQSISFALKNFLEVVRALHRYAFILMNNETMTQKERERMIKSLSDLRAKLLKDCVTIYRRDPQSLKLYVEYCLAQDFNQAMGGSLETAESLGAEIEMGQEHGDTKNVYTQDYLAGLDEKNLSWDDQFGVIVKIPQEITNIVKAAGFILYHIPVGAQEGGTCFLLAATNAKALEELIENNKPITGKTIRDTAERYERTILSTYTSKKYSDDKKGADCRIDYLRNYGPKLKLSSRHFGLKGKEKFVDSNINYPLMSFADSLQFSIASLKKKDRGVVSVIGSYFSDRHEDGHAFTFSFVKMKKDEPIKVLYMESNNIYLGTKFDNKDYFYDFLEALPSHLAYILAVIKPDLMEKP